MRAFLSVVLVAFGAFNVHVALREGYWSVFPPFPNLAMTQMFLDLAVALSLFSAWMVMDWRRQGRPLYQVVPFLVATVLFGSMGPLLYLVWRGPGDQPPRHTA
jgi:hypothetical protein